MPRRAAARATPTGVLPARLCASSEPSPVITRSAPSSAVSKPARSSTSSMPGRLVAPSTARAAKPTPPAAPAPGVRDQSRPTAAATTVAQRRNPASSAATSAGEAPFCGPYTSAAPSGPVSGLSTSAARMMSAGYSAWCKPVRSRAATSRRPAPPGRTGSPLVSSTRAPNAWSRPAPPSVLALPPTPRTILRAPPLNLSGATTIFICTQSSLVDPARSIEQGDDRGRRVLVPLGQVLELGHVVELGPHRDVGDALQDDLDHDRHPVLGHQLLGLLERGPDAGRLGHPQRLAAEPLGHLDVVDAVAADLGRVDVVEGQLDAVVHVEAAL